MSSCLLDNSGNWLPNLDDLKRWPYSIKNPAALSGPGSCKDGEYFCYEAGITLNEC